MKIVERIGEPDEVLEDRNVIRVLVPRMHAPRCAATGYRNSG